jgi:hypothetical protein
VKLLDGLTERVRQRCWHGVACVKNSISICGLMCR